MNKNLLLKCKEYLNNQKNKSRRNKIFIGLSIVVFVITIYVLMVPGITMEEVLICLNSSHEHTTDCYGTASDKEDVINLTNMVEELPTVEDMNNNINNLTTDDEKNEYKDEIIATATILYSNYLTLDDKVKSKISNIDKLLKYNEQGLIELPDNSINNNEGFDNSTSTFILKDNSSKLETVATADTSKFVQINLYDYFMKDSNGKSINDKFNNDSKHRYPAFFQSFGPGETTITSKNLANWRFNFGDMITVDRVGAIRDNDNQDKVKGTINQNMPETQQALSGYIKNTLGNDGYPAINDGNLSLKYLFNSSDGYAKKQNTENISRLFQYDEITGKYYFDSRSNFAQFDSNTNTFKVFKQKLTPNFMIYPFGNFLPLNNIETETTQASTINKTYFDNVINSARTKGNTTSYGSMRDHYKLVADRMSEWSSVMTTRNDGKNIWDAAFVANQYFSLSGLPANITNNHLSDIYNIDFDEPTNFFFGMDMEMNFIQPKNGITGVTEKNPMIFEFSGDDDVWVFIDGILFLDLSGRHRHVTGKIDFEKGVVTYHSLDTSTGDTSNTPYKSVKFTEILKNISGEKPELNENGTFKNYSPHNFKFYYMERGAGSSVMKMNFNFPLVEKNSLMVTKELDNNNVDLVGNPYYDFQILKVKDGNKTNETFIDVGTSFDILDANGNKVGTGSILENGIFKLKAGQTAVFKEISADKGSYYVREIFDSNLASQYESVIVSGKTATINSNLMIDSNSFVGYESDIKDISDGHTSFVYTNKVNVDKFANLKITKNLEGIFNNSDVFKFEVKIDNEILPLGYKYTVNKRDESGNVVSTTDKFIEKDCDTCTIGYVLLTDNETATISNILAGSSYSVEEKVFAINGYEVKYNGQDVSDVVGSLVSEEEVEVNVINISTGTDLIIPLTKTIINPDSRSYDYTFKITEMEGSSIDSLIEKNAGYNDTVVIEDVINTKVLNEAFKLEYSRPLYDNTETIHYYKIEEISNDDRDIDIKYDSSIYIIKVIVTNTDSSFNARVAEVYKDGTNITEIDTNGNVSNIVEFVNKLLVDLNITKEVREKIEDSGEFQFEIEILDNEVPISGNYKYQKKVIEKEETTFLDMEIKPFGVDIQKLDNTEDGILIFDTNGKVNIDLAHNEVITIYGLPYDAEYKVDELTTNGYIVIHNVNSDDDIEGDIAIGKLDRDNTNIKFINIGGYRMPATGGSGTLIFGIIGLLLLIVPVIYIKYSFYRRKRGVV